MKKIFLKKAVSGAITIATISTFIPIGVSAEVMQYRNVGLNYNTYSKEAIEDADIVQADNVMTTTNLNSDIVTNQESSDELNDYGLTIQSKKYTTKIEYQIENEVVKLINQKREKSGAKPVVMKNGLLTQMARYKSDDVIQYNNDKLDLYDGSSVGGTLERLGYKCNKGYYDYKINYGSPNAEALFNLYCGVEDLRNAITNPLYTKISVGVVYDENRNMYVGTLIMTD